MRKLFECPAVQPIFEAVKASSDDVEPIDHFDLDQPIKMAYKLSSSVIYPKSIEKTNVQLAASVLKVSQFS